MDIRKLRIGNSLYYGDEIVKVKGIDVTQIMVWVSDNNSKPFPTLLDGLEPIPLTPELVKELGFFESEMAKDTPTLHGIYVDPYMVKLAKESKGDFSKIPTDELFHLWHIKLPNKYGEWKIFSNKGEIYVSYLHELENMYHYLTGRKL